MAEQMRDVDRSHLPELSRLPGPATRRALDEAAEMIRQAKEEAAKTRRPRRRSATRKSKPGGNIPAREPPGPAVVPDVATEPHPQHPLFPPLL